MQAFPGAVRDPASCPAPLSLVVGGSPRPVVEPSISALAPPDILYAGVCVRVGTQKEASTFSIGYYHV